MEHDPYVVSRETCGGCRYYRSLGGGESPGTNMFCAYTWETGDFKPMDMKCADCTYKDTKRTRRKPKKKDFWSVF